MSLVDLSCLALLLAPAGWLLSYFQYDEALVEVAWAGVCAVCASTLVGLLMPVLAKYTLQSGLRGKDLGKRYTPSAQKDIPEALGLLCGIVFLAVVIVGQVVFAQGVAEKVRYFGRQIPDLVLYNAALLAVAFMVLLGFVDDVVDLPWRYKLLLPSIASLPLLCTYNGATAIMIPSFARPLLWSSGSLTWLGWMVNAFAVVDSNAHGAIIELGWIFYLYMGLLAIFSTNAINIYAGINGLEAGQAFVIAAAALTTNCMQIVVGEGALQTHIFSITLLLPFLGTTTALLRYNLYPAQVFGGDTFCYFAGMTFAVTGILGHFSKTLLLFFVPQVINFLYSTPQLFRLVPCPRHRLPWPDEKTGLLVPSQYPIKNADGTIEYRDNMTLICLVLRVCGPMHEVTLVRVSLLLQAASCALGLWIRFGIVA